ncbi:hypothetical protein ACVJGD_007536 [Bradyrhizobium sp. USDA 10063]
MQRGQSGKLCIFTRITLFVDLAFTIFIREAFTNAFDASRKISAIACL